MPGSLRSGWEPLAAGLPSRRSASRLPGSVCLAAAAGDHRILDVSGNGCSAQHGMPAVPGSQPEGPADVPSASAAGGRPTRRPDPGGVRGPTRCGGRRLPFGGAYPARGVMFYEPDGPRPSGGTATCTLPDADRELCAAVLDDFVKRYEHGNPPRGVHRYDSLPRRSGPIRAVAPVSDGRQCPTYLGTSSSPRQALNHGRMLAIRALLVRHEDASSLPI